MRHTHSVYSLKYDSKSSLFTIHCECGCINTLLFTEKYPPAGWCRAQWVKLEQAARLFAESYADAENAGFTYQQVKK